MNDSDLLADDPRQREREELVAYLDGELSDDACHEVEQRLSRDDGYRRQMQQLAGAWDVLDYLQRVTAGERFAHTTVEMVALAADEDVRAQRAVIPRRRRLEWLAGLVVILLVAGVGYAVVSSQTPDQNAQLVEEYPVLENLDAYQQVGDVEFLRLLDDANLFPPEKEEPHAKPSS